MNVRNFFITVLYVAGAALIAAVFMLLLKGRMPDDVLILDLVVSEVVLSLFMLNTGALFVSQRSMQAQWGSLGVRIFFNSFYAVAAIAAMAGMHYGEVSFRVQLLAHFGLILMLGFGYYFTLISRQQVSSVAAQHKEEAQGLTRMRENVSRIEIAASMHPDKEKFREAISAMREELRYLSPSLVGMATELEQRFIHETDRILLTIGHTAGDELARSINDCITILKERKKFRYKE